MIDLTFIWIGVAATGLVCLGACWIAWHRYRDPFHPAFFLGAPCFAVYFLQPAMLLGWEAPQTLRYLSPRQLEFVVLVNGLGTLALLGATLGRGQPVDLQQRLRAIKPPKVDSRKLRAGGIALGFLGLAAFGYGIFNVGGLEEAYGRSYGGGGSAVGYVRDAYWLCLPAVALVLLSGRRGMVDAPLIALFSSPLVIHGLLGARRGPTASIVICLLVAYGFSRRWRPRPWQFVAGSAALGTLLLLLLANRNSIHYGSSDIHLKRGVTSYATQVGSSNEFIYGGGTIVAAQQASSFFWGGRYATVVFIRPIPRMIWPTKYRFAASAFGIPNLETAGANFGTGGMEFARTLGWHAPHGAAPGLIADLWREFWWGGLLALSVIGVAYRVAWRLATRGDLFWTAAYSLLCAFSIYLIAQTLEAMLFRFLLTAGSTTVAWFYATGKLPTLHATQVIPGRIAVSRR